MRKSNAIAIGIFFILSAIGYIFLAPKIDPQLTAIVALSTTQDATSPAQPPVTSLSIKRGDSIIITWHSIGATFCIGLNGLQLPSSSATSGTVIVTPTSTGAFTYTVSCIGPSGTNVPVSTSITAASTTAVTTPEPVTNQSSTLVSTTTVATTTSATSTDTNAVPPWNPVSALGVPWASDLTAIAANVINIKTDPRLSVKAMGDGVTDDTAAVRDAIGLASSTGGGTVYFPPGKYELYTPSNAVPGSPFATSGSFIYIPSNVILRGASSSTSLLYLNDADPGAENNWPGSWGGFGFIGDSNFWSTPTSRSGMTDLGIYNMNDTTSSNAVIWNIVVGGNGPASDIFFNNVDIHLGYGRPLTISGVTNILVQNSRVESTALVDGPLTVDNATSVTLLNNVINYNYGRVELLQDDGLDVRGNSILRDAQGNDQQEGTAIESGGIEASFSSNVRVLDNLFQTFNAPADETGDGEGFMVQNSIVQDARDEGVISSLTPTTLTDASALWEATTTAWLANFPGESVVIYTGAAAGETRTIQSMSPTTKTLTLVQPWDPMPAPGDRYTIFPWDLQNATVANNTFIDDPMGVILWDGCDNCTIENNYFKNTGNTFIDRTPDEQPVLPGEYNYEQASRGVHEMTINLKVLDNTMINTTGIHPSILMLAETAPANPAIYNYVSWLNIQVGNNTISPWSANPSKLYNYGFGDIYEGFWPCDVWTSQSATMPPSTIFQNYNYWNNTLNAPVAYAPDYAVSATTTCTVAAAPNGVGVIPLSMASSVSTSSSGSPASTSALVASSTFNISSAINAVVVRIAATYSDMETYIEKFVTDGFATLKL